MKSASLKRKHSSLTIADKVQLLQKLDSGISVKNVCNESGIRKSSVCDLKKQPENILKYFAESDIHNYSHVEKLYNFKSVDVDRALMEWIQQ